ncbi:MAG: hypothetical protein PVH61_44350 [Candidatus Aminicenantes bacterium]|jgi:hypothetical protein
MKVICDKIIDEITKEEIESSPFLTIGKEYVVLGIHIDGIGIQKYQIISDDNDDVPIITDISQFRIICNRIPKCWRVGINLNGNLYFSPAEWMEMGFWEDLYDEKPETIAIYERIRDEIIAESS